MKAFLIAFAIIVVGSLATIAAFSLNRSAAKNEITHETRDAMGFHRIEITGAADVTLVQGAAEGVSVDAPASARVRTDVQNGTLVVDTEDRRRAWMWFAGRGARQTPRVTINLRELDQIEAAGTVKLVADTLRSPNRRLEISRGERARAGKIETTTLRLD